MPARKGSKTMKNKRGGKNALGLLRGGSGATDHAINVFGGIGQQHAAVANDNTIAMKGGKRRGGSMGVDLGAPLILTGLNQYMKRRTAKKGGRHYSMNSIFRRGGTCKKGGKHRRRR